MRNWCLRPTSHHTPAIAPKTRAAMDSVMLCLGSRLVSLGRVRGSHLAKKPNLAWTTSSTTKTRVTQAKTERAAKGYRNRCRAPGPGLVRWRQRQWRPRPSREHNDQHQAQHHPINGEDRWVDEVALLAITAGQQQGMAKLLQHGDLFVFGERTAQDGFLLLDLREDFVRQLADDVVLLRLGGQRHLHGLQITVNEFHDIAPVTNFLRSIRGRGRA